MLLFIDTEFTDFLNIDLISIGLVSEDGRHQFYAERTDFCYDWCNDFVRSAVWAHLGADPAANVKRDELRQRLSDWFKTLPAAVTIACDSYTDLDIRPLGESAVFNDAICRYHAEPGRPWHHAYHDAAAIRMGWLANVAADSAASQG
jgi:hypothetical protein